MESTNSSPKNSSLQNILRWLMTPFVVFVFVMLVLTKTGWEFFVLPFPLLVLVLFSVMLMREMGKHQSNIYTILTVWLFFILTMVSFRMGFAIQGDGSKSNWTLEVLELLINKRFTYDGSKYDDIYNLIFEMYVFLTIVYFLWGVSFLGKNIERTGNLTKKQILTLLSIPIVLVLANLITIFGLVRPTIEAKPDWSFLDNIQADCRYPYILDVNGVPEFMWPEHCEPNPRVEAMMLKERYRQQGMPHSVKLTVNGKENPDPITYNSIFRVDFEYEGDFNCYPTGGPVPLADESTYNFSDESFVIITNAIPKTTHKRLIARNSDKGYTPEITIGLRCEGSEVEVSDSITIPITR